MSNNENEMERMQQGLEAFLDLTEKDVMKSRQKKPQAEPEVDLIGDRRRPHPEHKPTPHPEHRTVQHREREVDIIGSGPEPEHRRADPPRQRVTVDLRENKARLDAEKKAAKKELREAKKLKKEQKEIEIMRSKAESIKAETAKRKSVDVIEVNGSPKGSKKKGKEEKPKKGHKGLVFLLALICLLAVVWCYGMTKIYNKMQHVSTPNLESASLKDNGVVNILLIGSDSRDDSDDGRSDAMILMSISSKTKTVQMTSLLRDMYVEIPGHDGNRLNAAYAYGGPELLMATISQNFGIEVNRYVVVNFKAFANLVDAVGGVTLNLSNDEVQWVNAYLNEYNLLQGLPIDNDYLDASLSGDILLDGPQALAYSRNRYIGTDFGRTERQRKVLSAVIKKLPKAALTNSKGLVDGLFPNLTTNLSRGEFIYLSTIGWKMVAYDMEQNMIPAQGTYSDANIRGMAVLQVDFEANKKILREKLFGE